MYQGYGSASNYGSNHRAQQSTNLSYGRNHGYGPTVQSEPQTNSNYDLTIDLLRHATLEALLNSGNEEISRIYAEAEEAPELRKQVLKLETQVDVLKALQKDQAIMMMNMNMNNNTAAAANPLPVLETQVKLQNREVALRAAFPMAFNQAITVTLKQHNEYPEVTFWLHDEWSTYKKKRNTGSRYRFLQDKDGEEITEARLNEIRAFLLGAFNELQELLGDNKALPQTWANATKGRAVINACHSELRRQFEEFTLCNGDWKARSFMIEWYPNWARNHLDSDAEDDIEITDSTVPAKRAVPSESSKRPIKKIKVKQERFKIPEIRDPLYALEILLYALTLATAAHLWTLIPHQLTIKLLPSIMWRPPLFLTSTKQALLLSIPIPCQLPRPAAPALTGSRALFSLMCHRWRCQLQIPYQQYLLCLAVYLCQAR
ncbi:hypothetical protein JOM56_013600 [Amanita muscaria]